MHDIQTAMEGVLSERFPNSTERQRAYAARCLVTKLGLTQEVDRQRKCECRHGQLDHSVRPDGKCIANMVTRHTPCPCTEYVPMKRTRFVTAWSSSHA